MAMDAVPLWGSPAMTELGDDNVSHAMAMVQFYQIPVWDVPQESSGKCDNA